MSTPVTPRHHRRRPSAIITARASQPSTPHRPPQLGDIRRSAHQPHRSNSTCSSNSSSSVLGVHLSSLLQSIPASHRPPTPLSTSQHLPPTPSGRTAASFIRIISLDDFGDGHVFARVASVRFGCGATVFAGEVIGLLETTTQTLRLTTPVDGTIHAWHIAEGDEILVGAPLVSIEPTMSAIERAHEARRSFKWDGAIAEHTTPPKTPLPPPPMPPPETRARAATVPTVNANNTRTNSKPTDVRQRSGSTAVPPSPARLLFDFCLSMGGSSALRHCLQWGLQQFSFFRRSSTDQTPAATSTSTTTTGGGGGGGAQTRTGR